VRRVTMKEIKAYIQRYTVNKVVRALEKARAPGITIVEVHPVGYGYDPNYFEQRFEDVFKRYKNVSVVKLEVVCDDQDVERLVQSIQQECCTGEKGDGRIFVSDVIAAVRIRDGVRGTEAL
jgi:nitrogen regulatory protein P-II 1